MTRLIDTDALIKWIDDSVSQFGGTYSTDMHNMWGLFKDYLIKNAPTVEIPENEVNCVLTMFGNCSYNKTGCSDCEIKDKIRKALNNERPHGKWIPNDTLFHHGKTSFRCSVCNDVTDDVPTCLNKPLYIYCPVCGADMRGGKDNE